VFATRGVTLEVLRRLLLFGVEIEVAHPAKPKASPSSSRTLTNSSVPMAPAASHSRGLGEATPRRRSTTNNKVPAIKKRGAAIRYGQRGPSGTGPTAGAESHCALRDVM